MPSPAIINHEQVLGAVTPELAIERVRDGFKRYATGQWGMPAKIYLDAPPKGDFRAMPARGDGLAIVKWVTSFPGNTERGLPVVYGTLIVSDDENGQPRAFVDGRSVTALRTGAAAAVATQLLARKEAKTVGIIGSGLHGTWVARSLCAVGFCEGVCFDIRQEAAEQLARETGWQAGSRAAALDCDVVCTITPGLEPVVRAGEIKPGRHYNAMGADGPGKAEFERDALLECDLYCDEWEQSSHGGEITPTVKSGDVKRGDVVEIGWLLTGAAAPAPDGPTLFDSTGLAIQDLAICKLLIELLEAGELEPSYVDL